MRKERNFRPLAKKAKPVRYIHSIYLDAKLRNKLQEFAKEVDVSRNALVALAISEFLASGKDKTLVKQLLKDEKARSIAYHNFTEFKRSL